MTDTFALPPLALYVHIPFCEQICWYCGCNTGAAGRKHRLADYLAAYAQPSSNFPVGVVTGLAGAPFLLWLLATSRPSTQSA